MDKSRDFAPKALFRLELLGGTAIKGRSGREIPAVLHQSKRFALLAWLALHSRTGFCRRDQLLGVFWPNHDAERGRNALRQGVHFLRQHLGAEAIVGRGDEELGIDPGVLDCDAVLFEDALDRGAPEEALALYRGDLMPGFFLSDAAEFERWVEGLRQRLRERAVAAAWDLSQRLAPETDDAVRWARQAVALAPNDEPGVGRLMTLLAARGDRAGAVQAYEAFARRLRDELELEPSAETEALVARLRRDELPRLEVVAPSRAVVAVSPAPTRGGSAPVTAADAAAIPVAGRRLAWLLAGVALVGAVSVVVWRTRDVPARLDPDLIAVAPFEVLESTLSLWETGMASVLSANLDGAGPLRSTPPSVGSGRWRGPTDRIALGTFARHSGAGLALGGRLLRLAADSVRLWGTLVDASTDEALLDVELDGSEDRLTATADSLTVRVLRALGRERPIGAVRRTSIGSTSMPALRAFLRGEQYYRMTQWDSALAYHRRAVAEDSSFAPALRRVSDAMAWLGTVHDDSARLYRLAAGRFNHGLAVRESLLVQAESLFASLQTDTLDAGWWVRRRRLSETLGQARRR